MGDFVAQLLTHPLEWVASLLGQLVLLIFESLTQFLQFNTFINHPVVENGWKLVRDLVNTGFIAILLIIAFGTMFGVSRINWKQQVPRLVIAAIAVNFSKLIVGLFIDIGQVIMLAFVNAIAQVGFGNFLNLIQFNNLHSISTGGSTPYTGVNLFITYLFVIGMELVILIVTVLMVSVVVYRIVLLWVLTILSPLAFFMGASQGVLGKAAGMYSQWWSKFTASIMIGPVLAFFLWLAMSAVQVTSGLATGFTPSTGQRAVGAGIISDLIQGNTFTSFIIGIALLLAGLEVAAESAGQIGGFAAAATAKATRLSNAAVKLPFALTAAGAGLAARKGGGEYLARNAKAGYQVTRDKFLGELASGPRVFGMEFEGTESRDKRKIEQAERLERRGDAVSLARAQAIREGVKPSQEANKQLREREQGRLGNFAKGMSTTDLQKMVTDLEFNSKGEPRKLNFQQKEQLNLAKRELVTNKDKREELLARDPSRLSQLLEEVSNDESLDEKLQEQVKKIKEDNWITQNDNKSSKMRKNLKGKTTAEVKKIINGLSEADLTNPAAISALVTHADGAAKFLFENSVGAQHDAVVTAAETDLSTKETTLSGMRNTDPGYTAARLDVERARKSLQDAKKERDSARSGVSKSVIDTLQRAYVERANLNAEAMAHEAEQSDIDEHATDPLVHRVRTRQNNATQQLSTAARLGTLDAVLKNGQDLTDVSADLGRTSPAVLDTLVVYDGGMANVAGLMNQAKADAAAGRTTNATDLAARVLAANTRIRTSATATPDQKRAAMQKNFAMTGAVGDVRYDAGRGRFDTPARQSEFESAVQSDPTILASVSERHATSGDMRDSIARQASSKEVVDDLHKGIMEKRGTSIGDARVRSARIMYEALKSAVDAKSLNPNRMREAQERMRFMERRMPEIMEVKL